METIRRYRAMGQLCRQQAAYNPDQSWQLLSEAERWEHLAEAEIASHFSACNPANPKDEALASNATGPRWQTNAAA